MAIVKKFTSPSNSKVGVGRWGGGRAKCLVTWLREGQDTGSRSGGGKDTTLKELRLTNICHLSIISLQNTVLFHKCSHTLNLSTIDPAIHIHKVR